MIATGVSAAWRREVLGCAVGDSETVDLWAEFLRTLRDCGQGGTQPVICDHHRGPMKAIEATMAGLAWQQCSPPGRDPLLDHRLDDPGSAEG